MLYDNISMLTEAGVKSYNTLYNNTLFILSDQKQLLIQSTFHNLL